MVIIGVDDGESALCEGDSAEGVAEAETTPGEHETNERPFQPVRNVKTNLDDVGLRYEGVQEILNSKH